MDTLNDYCHVNILKYLSPKDQLALFEASNFCISNVQYVWRQRRRFYLDAGAFKYFDKKPELLDDFLLCISPKAQHLDLKSVTIDNLKSWTRYKFPEMRSLEYTMDESYGRDNGVQFIILMAELFPFLNHIKPYGSFHFSRLMKWLDLRKLDLSECWSYSYYECDDIDKLKMLEELLLPKSSVLWTHEKQIIDLPNLKALTIQMDSEQHYDFMSEMREKEIEKVTFLDSIWDFHKIDLERDLSNLRQLSIVNDINYSVEELQDVITVFPLLERLDLFNFPSLTSEVELWKTVEANPSLKILNLSDTQLYVGFFDIGRDTMKNILDKRSVPLTLYCHNTGNYEYLIRMYFKHPNLIVSFEYLKIDHIDDHFAKLLNAVQLNWTPVKMRSTESVNTL